MTSTQFSQRLLTLKKNENPGPQEHAQHPPLGREEVAQTLREVKNKKEKALATIEKPETKIVKKTEEGSDSYGTPFNNSDSPTSEKTKAKTKQWENYQE